MKMSLIKTSLEERNSVWIPAILSRSVIYFCHLSTAAITAAAPAPVSPEAMPDRHAVQRAYRTRLSIHRTWWKHPAPCGPDQGNIVLPVPRRHSISSSLDEVCQKF